MKKLFDELSFDVSKRTTEKYSTSFSLGIRALSPDIRPAIYALYGFVRLADEIVDSFHTHDKATLLARFKHETETALQEKISLNPILQAFQQTVHDYQIDPALIQQFLHSMEMDLQPVSYNNDLYKEYILGSAEVVGLMCLHVFVKGNKQAYEKLKPYAMMLGSAFQKINFLRDLKEDYLTLGRVYFPNIAMNRFDDTCKQNLEAEIEQEFSNALTGIKMLPDGCRWGVYLAFMYYRSLLEKIKRTTASDLLQRRIRVPNAQKLGVMVGSYVRFKMDLL